MYLIERHLQLEIYFSCFEQLPEYCATIRKHVLESIRLTEEKLHIIQEGEGAITKVDSFLCSCGKGSAHHTCAYNSFSGILECTESEETGERCKLDPQHKLWLGMCTLPTHSIVFVIVTFCTLATLFTTLFCILILGICYNFSLQNHQNQELLFTSCL